MKKLKYVALLSIPLFTLCFCTSSSTSSAKEEKQFKNPESMSNEQGKNIVVLELFTSQGCSSCPPADRLLGTYASKENVIVLSFHVDYWDRLGWKDPFSSKEYTKRQYDYASALHSSVYTPQLVINGQAEMVGSDAGKINATIDKILSGEPGATVAITKINAEDGKINIDFTVSGNIKKDAVNIALVEKKTTTDVKAGENGGVTLTNYNVVTAFKTINKVETGNNHVSIEMPNVDDVKNSAVVVFLQQKGNNRIDAGNQSVL